MKQSREHQLIPTIADTLPDSYVRDYFPTANELRLVVEASND